jgi:hypothetical protein
MQSKKDNFIQMMINNYRRTYNSNDMRTMLNATQHYYDRLDNILIQLNLILHNKLSNIYHSGLYRSYLGQFRTV